MATRLLASPLRILIVDDYQDAAEMFGMMLAAWGHETRVAHDGLSALEEARSFRPHLVLLDLGLPKLDGYDAARQLREQPWASQTRLVAVTGWDTESERRRCLEAGFDRHVVKPVDPATLQALVAEVHP